MRIKNHVLFAAMIGLTALAPFKAWAAFSSVSRTTSTAIAPLTGAGTVAMSVFLKNLSDNSTTTQVYWSGVSLPTSFVRASAYAQVDSTVTAAGGAIQIYTDNTAADASPQFTYAGSTSSVNPSGLVDTTTTTKALPLVWSVKDTTTTAPTAADPTNSGDANSFQWLFMKDRQTPTNVSLGSTQFTDGEAFVTVKRVVDNGNSGMHFGQADTEFGAAASPDFVYFEADFRNAVTPRTYKTSVLRLEAYTQ